MLLVADRPTGYGSLSKALGYIAGRHRDDSRLSPVVGQLRHGLHTDKLYLQVLSLFNLLNSRKKRNTSYILGVNNEISEQIHPKSADDE